MGKRQCRLDGYVGGGRFGTATSAPTERLGRNDVGPGAWSRGAGTNAQHVPTFNGTPPNRLNVQKAEGAWSLPNWQSAAKAHDFFKIKFNPFSGLRDLKLVASAPLPRESDRFTINGLERTLAPHRV